MAVRNWTPKPIRNTKSLNERLHLTAYFSSPFFFFFDTRVNLVKIKFQWNDIKSEIYGRVIVIINMNIHILCI